MKSEAKPYPVPKPEPTVTLREYIDLRIQEVDNKAWLANENAQLAITRAEESATALVAANKEQSEAKFVAVRELIAQQLDSTRVALAKSEAGYEERFRSVNAFREQLRAQASDFASKDALTTLATRVAVAEAAAASAKETAVDARSRSKDQLALIMAGASTLIAVGTAILASMNTGRIH